MCLACLLSGIRNHLRPTENTFKFVNTHYKNVIMSGMTSQMTSLTIVYSTVYSRHRWKKTSKLRVTGLCDGNSPVTGEFMCLLMAQVLGQLTYRLMAMFRSFGVFQHTWRAPQVSFRDMSFCGCFLHDRPWIKSITIFHAIASQLSVHCDAISNRLWRHQQNVNRASKTRGRCVKIAVFIAINWFVMSC